MQLTRTCDGNGLRRRNHSESRIRLRSTCKAGSASVRECHTCRIVMWWHCKGRLASRQRQKVGEPSGHHVRKRGDVGRADDAHGRGGEVGHRQGNRAGFGRELLQFCARTSLSPSSRVPARQCAQLGDGHSGFSFKKMPGSFPGQCKTSARNSFVRLRARAMWPTPRMSSIQRAIGASSSMLPPMPLNGGRGAPTLVPA